MLTAPAEAQILAQIKTQNSAANPMSIEGAAAKKRPGHFAELEELEAARKKKSKAEKLAAYDLFLTRHPNSRYAAQAKRERAALVK